MLSVNPGNLVKNRELLTPPGTNMIRIPQNEIVLKDCFLTTC
jgi:hypothetical protein